MPTGKLTELPAYAYLPGHHPHPTRDPRGHSHGKAETAPTRFDPDLWQACEAYRMGIFLFNAGYYWEAHEAWEGLWIAAGRRGPHGEFFQGLIQLAGAGLKLRQRMHDAAARLGTCAARHFERSKQLGERAELGGLVLDELIEFASSVSKPTHARPGRPMPDVEIVFTRQLEPGLLDGTELAKITASTVGHYQARAEEFWAATRTHDVRQNRAALLRHIRASPPLTILDLGCGPGRDLIAFRELGHLAIGVDGAARFCELARENSGCDVLHQDLLALDLPNDHFDGVFANATLFHVPGQELPSVLRALWTALVPAGVLFCSNPRGDNREGWQGARYGSYHDHARWRAIVSACGFEELEHYYRPPGRPRAEQPWLATVYRKVAE